MLVERMQHYVFPGTVLPNGTIQNALSLQLDSDAPFRLFGIVVWNLNVANGEGFDGEVAIRFTRPDGRLIQRQLTSSNLLYPGNLYTLPLDQTPSANAAMVSPIYPNVLYPANSNIQIDLLGLPSPGLLAPPGFIVVFCGVKIYEQGAIWAPTYPAKWKARPYLDNVTMPNFDVTTGVPSLNNTFTAQRDSDFVWQAGVYSDWPVGSTGPAPICQLPDLGVIVRDYTQKAYSNGYVPAALLFPFLTAQAPGFLYPEIYVPTNQQLYFDINYLYPGFVPQFTPISVLLGLKGMKVYPQ